MVLLTLAPIAATPAAAQSDSARAPDHATPWIAQGALLLAAAALDRPMRRSLRGGDDSPVVRDLSRTGDALGTAAHLVPAMAGSYVVARLAHSPRIATGVLDVAVGYTVSDITEGLLKTAAGRERPFLHGDPARFHPFTAHGDYHSFPSAHVTHITSIASAAAMEWPNPYVRSIGTAASVLVMWQRVHADQHWTSDVVAGAILGHALGDAAVREMRVLRRHR